MKLNRALLLLVFLAAASAQGAVVTGYCACAKCCGATMGGSGITASGKRAAQGVTVAGPRALALGTRVHIAGVGVRVVQDRLAPRFDQRFDIFFKEHSEAQRFGKQTRKVRVLK